MIGGSIFGSFRFPPVAWSRWAFARGGRGALALELGRGGRGAPAREFDVRKPHHAGFRCEVHSVPLVRASTESSTAVVPATVHLKRTRKAVELEPAV